MKGNNRGGGGSSIHFSPSNLAYLTIILCLSLCVCALWGRISALNEDVIRLDEKFHAHTMTKMESGVGVGNENAMANALANSIGQKSIPHLYGAANAVCPPAAPVTPAKCPICPIATPAPPAVCPPATPTMCHLCPVPACPAPTPTVCAPTVCIPTLPTVCAPVAPCPSTVCTPTVCTPTVCVRSSSWWGSSCTSTPPTPTPPTPPTPPTHTPPTPTPLIKRTMKEIGTETLTDKINEHR
jgi:hypothetical protein